MAVRSVVEFSNAPIYGEPVISEDGGSFAIHSYNCNAAVVSGKGAISGTPYKHSKRIVKGSPGGTPRGKTVSVSDATLVTPLNSAAVLERLMAFYGAPGGKGGSGGAGCIIVYY